MEAEVAKTDFIAYASRKVSSFSNDMKRELTKRACDHAIKRNTAADMRKRDDFILLITKSLASPFVSNSTSLVPVLHVSQDSHRILGTEELPVPNPPPLPFLFRSLFPVPQDFVKVPPPTFNGIPGRTQVTLPRILYLE
jgi:hypothetical protein